MPVKVYTLACSLIVPAPIERAFSIFEDPYNLGRITPSWLRFRVTSAGRVVMRRGAEIEYRLSWLGIPLAWKTLVTEYDPPRRFVDEQAKGPYSLWRHHHMFREVEGGTEVADRVEYALPLGLLGRLAHRLIVAEQLRRIFRFRQRKIAEMLGGGVTVAEPEITPK
ncbi:MAG: SRPBCC family protein [Bryobacteraceae bacterium]